MMCSNFFIQSSVNGRSTTPLSPLFVQQTIPGRLLNQSNQSVFPLNEESPSFLFCCCCRIASFCYRITMLSLISSRMSLRFSLNHSRSISSTFWSDARRCSVHRGDRIPDLIFFPPIISSLSFIIVLKADFEFDCDFLFRSSPFSNFLQNFVLSLTIWLFYSEMTF